jgi:GntR family transcriptional regulator/MocR family aminotransferase
VLESYEQLAAEGYLQTLPRGRTTVRGVDATSTRQPLVRRKPPPPYDLYPTTPDLTIFPRAAWQRAYTKALRAAPIHALRYPDPAGAVELRIALAAYLRRVRGVVASPERIMICSGFREGLGLLTEALLTTRPPTVGLEEPGLYQGRAIVEAAGGRWQPLPVDEAGLVTDTLSMHHLDAVMVTPAHQFPTGFPLAAERRAALADWAAHGRVVLEDDYDAEFRYDRPPLAALQGLIPEHTAYAGSISKTLSPALRLGWMVLPATLVEPVVAAKRVRDAGRETLSQLALAEMLDRGEYDRHLRHARQRYRRRRDALIEALNQHLPFAIVSGVEAGLHIFVTLPPDIDPGALDGDAEQRGVGITTVDRFRNGPATGQSAIVIGYSNLPEQAADRAARLLADAIAKQRRTGRPPAAAAKQQRT